MREYDLWMDESGTFTKDDHNILGGFLLQRSNGHNGPASWEATIRTWFNDACKGAQNDARLLVQAQCPEKQSQLEGKLREYEWGHCKENGSHALRWWIQPEILGRFAEKIYGNGGQIVIFDNPNIFVVDNTTNYLATLTLGLYQLYSSLCADAGDEVRIYPHMSKRKNRTADKNYGEDVANSPTGAAVFGRGEAGARDEETIQQWQYNKMETYLCFAHAQRFEIDKGLREMLRNITIVKGNPESIIMCDYICNTYYVGIRDSARRSVPGYWNTFLNYNCKVYDIFHYQSEPMSNETFLAGGDFFRGFQKLKERTYPDQFKDEFFSRLSEAGAAEQNKFVSELVNELNPRVYRHIDNPALRTEIEGIMRSYQGSALPEECCAELDANLYLFLYALYEHICNASKTREMGAKFEESIKHVHDMAMNADLQIKYRNRTIIEYTDSFHWNEACGAYDALKKYFDSLVSLHEPFGGVRCDQYGKAAGSYLQLLRQLIRTSKGEDRKIYTGEAEEVYKIGDMHFCCPEDLSRHHQNICDVEAEIHRYDSAFDHLCRAAKYSAVEDPAEDMYAINETNCRLILDISGDRGEHNGFLFNHYVRLMQELFIAEKEAGKTLLAALGAPLNVDQLKDIPFLDAYAEACRSIGSSLARAKEHPSRSAAAGFFNRAIEVLSSTEQPLCYAMAVSFRAEQIALAMDGKLDLPANRRDEMTEGWKKDMAKLYARYGQSCEADPQNNNIFALQRICMEPTDARDYMSIARAIAY